MQVSSLKSGANHTNHDDYLLRLLLKSQSYETITQRTGFGTGSYTTP